MKVRVRMRVPEKEIRGCNNCLNIVKDFDDNFVSFCREVLTEVLPQFNLYTTGRMDTVCQDSYMKIFRSLPLECRVANGQSVHTNCYLRIATEFSGITEYVTECAIVPVE